MSFLEISVAAIWGAVNISNFSKYDNKENIVERKIYDYDYDRNPISKVIIEYKYQYSEK